MAMQTVGNTRGAKRVVFYHDSHGFGGMELYMLRLMRHLDVSRYTPMVLVPGYRDAFRSSPTQFMEAVRAAGLPLLRPPDPGTHRGFSALREVLTTIQLLRSKKVDLLHIHTCRPEGARKIIIAARLAGVPRVVRSEHFPPSITIRPSSKYLVKPLDWLTDCIVTGSEGDRQEQISLLNRPASKVYRTYNSVELDRFDPEHNVREAKIKLGLDPAVPVIGSVGRLSFEKGHRYLIEALSEVVDQCGPVHLLLVGDGELREELEALTRGFGIEPLVHFTGFQDDVLPYMQATDIAVMPSLWEVFSLAMLEFMALGKPVVASDHSSFREAITDGENGLLVPRKDSHSLAQALLKLLNDEQLRMRLGKAGLERVRANFSFERLANDIMDLYDRVLN